VATLTIHAPLKPHRSVIAPASGRLRQSGALNADANTLYGQAFR
jgi:hypothetical protein